MNVNRVYLCNEIEKLRKSVADQFNNREVHLFVIVVLIQYTNTIWFKETWDTLSKLSVLQLVQINGVLLKRLIFLDKQLRIASNHL